MEGPQLEHEDVGTFDLAAQGIVSCDLALRLSADLKNLALGGFLFGRNKARCDLVLGHEDEVKRISNIHFRIYINEYGVIMLEDQSTNGTVVDSILLRAKDKENGKDYRHTLELGSMIVLTMTPPEEDFRFIVRIPQRDDEAESLFQNNLTNYFHRQNQAQAEKRARMMGSVRPPVSVNRQVRQNNTHKLRLTYSRLRMSALLRQINPTLLLVDISRSGEVETSTTRSARLARVHLLSCTRSLPNSTVFHMPRRNLRRDVS